jgi:uncharacterized coiled-coil protein SlyX
MENNENSSRSLITDNSVRTKVETAKKEGMTRGVIISGIIGIVLVLTTVGIAYNIYEKDMNKQVIVMQVQNEMFTNQLVSRDSVINEWLLTFDQIESDLNQVKQKEQIITVNSGDSELSADRKTQLLNDIKYINTMLDSNRKKIAYLSAQLEKSGGSVKSLQNRIAALETSLMQHESDVAELKQVLVQKDFELGQLNTRMTALDVTIMEQTEKISNQTQKINQAFVTTGTYKDLKERGIITKEGGFLGLGRTESVVKNLADNDFNKIDVTETRTIPVNSKEAKLITSHPSNSYQLVRENEDKIAYIEIKDPEQFWKTSKYAVVEIVK